MIETLLKAIQLREKGNLQDAIATLIELVQAEPEYCDAYIHLAHTQAEKKNILKQ